MTRSLGHRAPLLWLVLPFCGGLSAAKVTELQNVSWPLAGALAAAAFAICSSGSATWRWAGAVLASMVLAGAASYTLHRARLPAWDSLPAREARLSLRIDRLFVQADPRRVTGLGTISRSSDHLGDLLGQRIYFSFSLRKGDRLPGRL